MKRELFLTGIVGIMLAFALIFTGCPQDPPAFVAVTSITNVPTTGIVGIAVNLNRAVVNPSDATNKTILWSVKSAGTTAAGAAITGTSLTATGAGTVWVTATIANGAAEGTAFTNDYEITVYSSVEDMPVAERWNKYVSSSSKATLDYSIDTDGVVTVTVGGAADPDRWHTNVEYRYTAEAGKKYKYTFEAWTASGTRTTTLQYYSNNSTSTYLNLPVQLTTERQTFALVGKEIPTSGIWNVEFQCADTLGTFYVKIVSIEETTEEPTGKWGGWANNSTTLDYSVATDGVVTITVGGTVDDIWGAGVSYEYSAEAGKKYKYTFEAWTESGTRSVGVSVYSDDPDEWAHMLNQSLTTARTEFTCISAPIIPHSGNIALAFRCGEATGTFYVKIVSIEETT
ncbi:hypothetical protein FACS189496_3410 [Bacilli bacterium]|nr:hypothetical protein FACS189496_3410 [Bacilli bacterium]